MLLVLLFAFYPNLSDRLGGATMVDYAEVNGVPNRLIYTLPPEPFELRKQMTLVPYERPVGLYVSMLADIDVFWDGEPIGRGGMIDNFYVIDGARKSPGSHTLLIRARPPRDVPRVFVYGIAVGDYATMTRSRVVSQVFPLAALGVFVVVGVYYLALWFAAGRQRSLLVFALLCFAASLLVIAECYRWIAGYPYPWHVVRLQVINTLTFVVSLLLPSFFVLDLGVPRARWWAFVTAGALAIVALAPFTFDTRCLAMFGIGIAVSLAAIARGRRDIPAAIGVLALAAALLGGGFSFGDRTFFLGFVFLIACLLLSLTLQLRRQRREHEDARIRAARLEIELLKRSIQPHFLMNTLTAAVEWIEEEPAEGARFLDAIAGELRILNEISGAALIPIDRELELCRSHLTIMSYRKGMQFELETSGIDHASTIPPAVFHTLLENAISHNRYRDARVVFHLGGARSNGHRSYVVETPRTTAPAAAIREGIGLRYVKARLEETFPGRWQLDSEALEDRWRTTIVVPA